jgi:hypothetical protein
MQEPLPGLTYQRRKQFRPSNNDINYAYNIINRYVFNNKLKRPEIRQGIARKTWGSCHWLLEKQPSGSHCHIQLSDKWFCQHWFMNTLAHEMVHQWQWDVYRWELLGEGRKIYEDSSAHGPSFFAWRDRFDYYDLTLKTTYGQQRWFKYQNFTKC